MTSADLTDIVLGEVCDGIGFANRYFARDEFRGLLETMLLGGARLALAPAATTAAVTVFAVFQDEVINAALDQLSGRRLVLLAEGALVVVLGIGLVLLDSLVQIRASRRGRRRTTRISSSGGSLHDFLSRRLFRRFCHRIDRHFRSTVADCLHHARFWLLLEFLCLRGQFFVLLLRFGSLGFSRQLAALHIGALLAHFHRNGLAAAVIARRLECLTVLRLSVIFLGALSVASLSP